MNLHVDLCSLIEKGGVYAEFKGETPAEVYTQLCSAMSLPENVSSDVLVRELLKREDVLSTAVGNGIAIPHPGRHLIGSQDNEMIAVCFLKDNLDMGAPDGCSVHTLFLLLTSSPTTHCAVLSALARLVSNTSFKKLLETSPSKEQLLLAIKQFEV